jgi:hypothetical protein
MVVPDDVNVHTDYLVSGLDETERMEEGVVGQDGGVARYVKRNRLGC